MENQQAKDIEMMMKKTAKEKEERIVDSSAETVWRSTDDDNADD